ncbi:transcriptional repressor [Sedimentibacter sp. zth1]|uniref:Fur family transcriptional regulator n=1 Tax=Sedimentibacter sp. zth1 TaxID=2816908 RepID=UPI001A91C6B6|nr:transcriptional repressor [Sedimentibacter sp. zth1]QSX06748.1 transcriptional repressor [Sedimentibacter sp. zth1]
MRKRNTIQGQLVLDAVKQLANHPTAEDVYNYVVQLHPNISKGTVYRNLNSLSEDGLLLKISVPDAADRFDQTTHMHYHIKCMNCGKFEDVELEYMSGIDDKVSKATKYNILGHDIVFKGVCSECNSKNKKFKNQL